MELERGTETPRRKSSTAEAEKLKRSGPPLAEGAEAMALGAGEAPAEAEVARVSAEVARVTVETAPLATSSLLRMLTESSFGSSYNTSSVPPA